MMCDSAQEKRKKEWAYRKLWKANIRLKSTLHTSLPYDQSLLCLKDSVSWLEKLPVHDVAYERFVRQRDYYFRECEAHATKALVEEGKVLQDHLVEHRVIWSYDQGKVTEETSLFVPLGTSEYGLAMALKVAGSERLYSEGVHPEIVTTLEVERI